MNRPLTLPSPLLGERVASRRVRGFGGPNARSGTGILPVRGDRLEALSHYLRAAPVLGRKARTHSGNSLPLEKRSKPVRNFSRYSETQIRK
jgi:hypothetical protein